MYSGLNPVVLHQLNKDANKHVVYLSSGQVFGDLSSLTSGEQHVASKNTWQAITEVKLKVALNSAVAQAAAKNPGIKETIKLLMSVSESNAHF